MNLPNKLTIVRIILVPFILVFMLPLPFAFAAGWNEFVFRYGMILALFVFVIASITDYYDGKIARSQNLVSNFGKFLDPIADKLLILSVTIALVQLNRIHALVPIIFLFRDFVVTGVRMLGAEQQHVIAANNLGKAKTVSQIVAVIIIMVELALRTIVPVDWLPYVAYLKYPGDAAIWIAVVLAVVSGYQYILNNLSLLKFDK